MQLTIEYPDGARLHLFYSYPIDLERAHSFLKADDYLYEVLREHTENQPDGTIGNEVPFHFESALVRG